MSLSLCLHMCFLWGPIYPLPMVRGGSLAGALQAVPRFPGSVGFRGFWELRTGKVGLLGLRLVSCYSGMGRGGDGLQEVNPACTCSQELQEARQQLRNVLSSATATEDSRPAGGPTLKGWVVLRSAGWCAGFSLIPVVAVLQCFDLQNLLPLLPLREGCVQAVEVSAARQDCGASLGGPFSV